VTRLYDYDEAATELRVTRTWLQRHIKKLPHSKLGGTVYFTADDLAVIVRQHHHEPATTPQLAQAGAHPLAYLKPAPPRKRRSA
jgi:hypothetical protein